MAEVISDGHPEQWRGRDSNIPGLDGSAVDVMMLILRLLLALLATYRLAILVTEEDGPLFLFSRLRDFTDRRRYIAHQQIGEDSNLWGSLDDGLRCTWCAGVWAAGLCAALVWWPTPAGDVLLTWLGLAGGALFLERWHEKTIR